MTQPKRFHRIMWPFISVAVVLLVLLTTAAATTFTNLAATANLTVGGDATVAGDVSVGGNAPVTGDLSVGGGFDLTAQEHITVTDGETLTPTGPVQTISSSGNVSILLGAPTNTNMLYLINTDSTDSITITDTGTVKLSGNLVLGPDDTACLMLVGGNWYEFCNTPN